MTGGEGFIGSRLTDKLVELGHNVTVKDIRNKTSENVKKLRFPPYVDIVFHLAAQSRVQPSFFNPTGSFDTNVIGTSNIARECYTYGTKMIYAGSSSKHHNPYDSPYASSKFLGEEVCKTFKQCYDTNIEIARFYNVYGPGEDLDPVNGNVIGIWRYCQENGLTPKIVGDGNQRRDFTHVDDIVDGLIKIAFSDEKHEDAWELGTGVNYSINELALLFKTHHPEMDFEYIPEQKGNYRETLNTNTDAKDILKWNPTDKLQNYILNEIN